MTALLVMVLMIAYAYLVYWLARDRIYREFPPEDEVPPEWVRAYLDEWEDV